MDMQTDSGELLVVWIKGTFAIPKKGNVTRFPEEQAPTIEVDFFPLPLLCCYTEASSYYCYCIEEALSYLDLFIILVS
ncbi:MAG: hypothetical protein JRC86_02205 [Deltaproteobacteria bacterium]|nr:hypothetical protein [Deltaproteobacteria bacterium]